MSRLVRTTTQIEGRTQERWAMVTDEDELPVWDDAAELTVVGRPTPRADGLRRASGGSRYTVDVRLPGLLHAALLRSPVAHGLVGDLDRDAALAVPGVRTVLLPGDDAGLVEGSTWTLLHAEPRYAGQPVAAVAADTPAAAAAGVAALGATFRPLPFVVDAAAAVADQRFTQDPAEQERGDVDAALASAAARVEISIETPGHLQAPLEPHAAVARWTGDELEMWISTQGVFSARADIAAAFGIDDEQVRVVADFIGGAFGAKPSAGFEAILAAVLARGAGRPVRVVNDRHEEGLDGGRRAATLQTVRLGADAEGRLVAIDSEATVLMGAGGPFFPPIAEPMVNLYACPNVRAIGLPVRLELAPMNAYRAPGVMEGITALEQAMDELALATGVDPLELRRRNHADVHPTSGDPFSTKRLLECYDRVAELSGWSERARLGEPQSDGLLRGMGCASQIWWGSGNPPGSVAVKVSSRGIATVTTGIQDIGTGVLTTARMVAAEALGLPLEQVRVQGGDTAPNLYATLSGGSLTTASMMPAVRAAAHHARAKILLLAADVFEANADDLSLDDGRITSVDGALDEPVGAVLEKLGNGVVEASGTRNPNPPGFATHSFGCQVAQVSVDAGTGEVRVESIWAVHDVGRIINPLGASSQAEGGILQGLGFALLEEQVIDPTTGVPITSTFDDYKLPTIADLPEIVVDFVGVPDGVASSVGAKGLGEPPIIPTAAAIANAFAHATGRRSPALLTRRRVIEVLR